MIEHNIGRNVELEGNTNGTVGGKEGAQYAKCGESLRPRAVLEVQGHIGGEAFEAFPFGRQYFFDAKDQVETPLMFRRFSAGFIEFVAHLTETY